MEQPWFFVILMAVMYYGYIFASGTKVGKELMQECIVSYPKHPKVLVGILVIFYLWYAVLAGGLHFPTTLKTCLYLLIPAVLLWHTRKKMWVITHWDWLVIVALWVPFDLRLLGRRPEAIKDALDWPITAVSAVIIGVMFWVHVRCIEGTKLEFSFWGRDFFCRLKDIGLALAGFLVLGFVLIPFGMLIGFLHPRDFVTEGLKQGLPLWSIVWDNLTTTKYLVYFAKILVTIALSEEFLFRSIIQNFLEQTTNRPTRALIITSLLFGAAHFNNGAKGIMPMDWNWPYFYMATIAGLAYGLTFRLGTSIVASMLLHTLVDATWHTFFK